MRKPTAAAKGRRVRSESSELHTYGYDIFHSCPARTLFLAEDARTVGWVKTFWRVSHFSMKTDVTRKRKVGKPTRRCQIDILSEEYKRAIENIRGLKAKKRFSGRNPNFWAQNEAFTSSWALRSSHDNKIVQRKKYPFPK